MITIATKDGQVEVRDQNGVLVFRTPYKDIPISNWWFVLMRIIWKDLFARVQYPAGK
jgi:hypothetical protein